MVSTGNVLFTVVIVGVIAHFNSGVLLWGTLAAQKGSREGWAFLAGMNLARLIMGVVGAGAAMAILSSLLGWIKIDRTTWTLILLAGLALVFASLRSLLKARSGEDEAKAAREAMERQRKKKGAYTPGAAFTTAFALVIISPKQWLFVGAVVASLAAARLAWPVDIGLFVLFNAIASALLLYLALLRTFAKEKALGVIDKVGGWINRNMGTIINWMLLLIGVGLTAWGAIELF